MQPLFAHQIEGVVRLNRYDAYALLMEMGTGKSRVVIEDWRARFNQGRAHDLVVLAPKGCYLNWLGDSKEPGELRKWLSAESLARVSAANWSLSTAANRRQLEDLLYAKSPRFLSLNIEALNRPGRARDYLLEFVGRGQVIGVIDESTTICHEEAARTKWVLDELAPRLAARRILTGLVAPESPLDVYPQYKFLDWRILGQKTFFAFKNRYCELVVRDFRSGAKRALDEAKGIRPRLTTVVAEDESGRKKYLHQDELQELIMSRSYRVTKDEVFDLPPKVFQFWDVELTPEQAVAYAGMREIAMAKLANGEFATAKLKVDQLAKLQHILCGHVRTELGPVADIPENRTQAVVDILHQHAGKAIVWCPWPRAICKIVERLRQEFGVDSTEGYWGDTALDKRIEIRSRIQNDPTLRFIVANQSVGGKGNNWTAATLNIYYANSFDHEDRAQSEDRSHRSGQIRSVTYIDLRVRDTVDEKLIEVLRQKREIAAAIQGDEFKEWLR